MLRAIINDSWGLCSLYTLSQFGKDFLGFTINGEQNSPTLISWQGFAEIFKTWRKVGLAFTGDKR